MLRVLKKKHTRQVTPYYTYGQKVKTPHFARQPLVRKTYLATSFCILTVFFIILFSTITTEADRATSLVKQPTIILSIGKSGVSQPTGNAQTRGVSSANISVQSSTQVQPEAQVPIPPKPLWVNKSLFVDPSNGAAKYLIANPSATGASYISRMSKVPVAQWFGDWNTNIESDVNSYVSAAASTSSVPIVVIYNIPNRDCGGYSTGGASSLNTYIQWVQQVATGIGNRTAVVILEPDALGALDCLPATAQQERLHSIAQAVTILKTNISTSVYIDAGTPVWQPANVMAQRLSATNVAAADGFSLNVSYFATTADNRLYGDKLSDLIEHKHYVIDTSRNGGNNKPTGMQCNPSFASLGMEPTTNTGKELNDALLWIKIPWESDGACNGSPGPGQDYWTYAVQLAVNAGW